MGTTATVRNGIDVDRLLETIRAITMSVRSRTRFLSKPPLKSSESQALR